MTTTTTTISTNVNAVAPTALHRALKNPAVELIQSFRNNTGYNEMVTVTLMPGYYTADGATEFDAYTTAELVDTLAGLTTVAPLSTCDDDRCSDGVIITSEYVTHAGDVDSVGYDCPICSINRPAHAIPF